MIMTMWLPTLLIILPVFTGPVNAADNITVTFQPSSLSLQVGTQHNVTLNFSERLTQQAFVQFNYQEGTSITFTQDKITISALDNVTLPNGTKSADFVIEGVGAGSITLGINSSSTEIVNQETAFVKIKVVHSKILDVFIAIVGWIYFVAWSISFYPQVFSNWKRKSVIGLNFDFLAFNLTGFIAYSFFNVGLYWVAPIQTEYFADHPRGVNPVQLNDVIFALHAVLITFITIIQAIIYQRGNQKVSRVCFGILVCVWLFALITLFVTVGQKITWLRYLYCFSYIKLFITLIKYIPQALMNYRRKSTDGWSIGNILLDFTGGSFSLFQMFLISYNNDDWGSIFGDPTKFGLGAFSILFDILFMVQHYCLYRNSSAYATINDDPEIIPDPEDEDK